MKIKDVFFNYSIIDSYLMTNYGFSSLETSAIGDSKLYYDPQVSETFEEAEKKNRKLNYLPLIERKFSTPT